MVHVGLTGGIASGKSVAAAEFAALGAVVIDADKLARQVVEPGTAGLQAVREAFGESVIAADGSLDRPALGALVFADDAARDRLNAIVHPLVREQAARLRQEAEATDVVVEDIPLLVETGQADRFDVVVVIQAPEQERIRRMVHDRGMSEAEARSRMAAQASDEQRAAAADVVLHNAGTRAELEAKVQELYARLVRKDQSA